MARIFQDGFETGRPQIPGSIIIGDWLGSLWQFNQTSTVAFESRHIGVQSHIVNSGNYALEMWKTSTVAHRLQIFRDLEAELTEHYGRVEFYLSSVQTALDQVIPIIHFRDIAGNVVGSIRVEKKNPDAVTLHLYAGNSLVDSYTEAFLCDVWTRIEWRLLVDDTNGVFEVRRNGDSLLLFEGNTDPHESGHVSRLCLGAIEGITTTYVMRYDDVAVNDTLGDKNNAWPGRGTIIYLKPRGDGEHTDWNSSEQSANLSRHLVAEYIWSSLNSLSANFAYEAFNEDDSSYWRPAAVSGEWVGFKLYHPVALTRLWMGGQTTNYSPQNFKIEGSNDGDLWDTLSEETFINNGVAQEYDFVNTTAYKFYRIYVTSAYSSRSYLYDARFYQVPADRWAALVDIPDDGSLSRNWSDLFGDKISCLMLRIANDLGYDPASEIRAVQHLMKGRYVDGEAEAKAFIRLGADEEDSVSKKLMNDYQKYHQQIWDKNPFTDEDWTREEIDDLEAGAIHVEVG